MDTQYEEYQFCSYKWGNLLDVIHSAQHNFKMIRDSESPMAAFFLIRDMFASCAEDRAAFAVACWLSYASVGPEENHWFCVMCCLLQVDVQLARMIMQDFRVRHEVSLFTVSACDTHAVDSGPSTSEEASSPSPSGVPHMISVVFCSGGPGTGKTHITRHIIDSLTADGYCVLTSASTSAAAMRLHVKDASTIHSLAALPTGQRTLRYLGQTDGIRAALEAADIVVVDEMSMLTTTQLLLIMYRLRSCTRVGMRKKVLLLVGDHAQLPPICRHKPHEDGTCHLCHLRFSTAWRTAPRYMLSHSHRQGGDAGFLTFLNHVRVQQPTQDEIDAALGGCFLPEDGVDDALTAESTVICTHLEDVQRYNHLMLHRMRDHCLEDGSAAPLVEEVHEVDLVSNACNEPDLRTWLADRRFHSLPEVAVGARVIFTKNMGVKQGKANGATGVVTHLKVDQGGVLQTITVRLDASGKEVRVGRTHKEVKHHNGQKYEKRSFALALAYAITAHKSQGMTLDRHTVVHVRDAFAPGIVYVMLSRVTRREILQVVGHLEPQHFRPVPLD